MLGRALFILQIATAVSVDVTINDRGSAGSPASPQGLLDQSGRRAGSMRSDTGHQGRWMRRAGSHRQDPTSRRRRTEGLVWDCDFMANWVEDVPVSYQVYLNATWGEISWAEDHIPDKWCRDECLRAEVPCTGFYILEEGTIPGDGPFQCGFYSVDLFNTTKDWRHNTSGGRLCLRVGKNFDCDGSTNMLQPEAAALPGFQPLSVPVNGNITSNREALDWCKLQCNTWGCQSFWFQAVNTSHNWRSVMTVPAGYAVSEDVPIIQWNCGMYANRVDPADRRENGLPVVTGVVCDAV